MTAVDARRSMGRLRRRGVLSLTILGAVLAGLPVAWGQGAAGRKAEYRILLSHRTAPPWD